MARISWTFNLYKQLGAKDPKELRRSEAGDTKSRLAPLHAKTFALESLPPIVPRGVTGAARIPAQRRQPPPPPVAGANAANAAGAGQAAQPVQRPGPAPGQFIEPASLPDPELCLVTQQHSDQYRDFKIFLAEEASNIADANLRTAFVMPVANQGLDPREKIKGVMNHFDLEMHENNSDVSINLITALMQAAKGIHSDADLPAESKSRIANRTQADNFVRIEADGLLQIINGFKNFDEYFADFPAKEKEMYATLRPDADASDRLDWTSPIGKVQTTHNAGNGQQDEIVDVRIKLLLQLIGLRYPLNMELSIFDAGRQTSKLEKREGTITADSGPKTKITLVNIGSNDAPVFNLLTKSKKALTINPELQPEKRIYWKSYTGRVKAFLADVGNSTRKKARNASTIELEAACNSPLLSQKVRNTYLREKEKRNHLHETKNGLHNPLYTLKNTLLGKYRREKNADGSKVGKAVQFSDYSYSSIQALQADHYPKLRGYEKRDFERAVEVHRAGASLPKITQLPRPSVIATTEMANTIDQGFKTAFAECETLAPVQRKNVVLYFLRNAFVEYENAIRLGNTKKCITSAAECDKALSVLAGAMEGGNGNDNIKNAIKAVSEGIAELGNKTYGQETAERLKLGNLERYLQICEPDPDLAASHIDVFRRAYQYSKKQAVKESIEHYDRMIDESYALKPFFSLQSPPLQSRASRLESLKTRSQSIVEEIDACNTGITNISEEIGRKYQEKRLAKNALDRAKEEATLAETNRSPETSSGLIGDLSGLFWKYLGAQPRVDAVEAAENVRVASAAITAIDENLALLRNQKALLEKEKATLEKYRDPEFLAPGLSRKIELKRDVIGMVTRIESLFNSNNEADITVEKLELGKSVLERHDLFVDLKSKFDEITNFENNQP